MLIAKLVPISFSILEGGRPRPRPKPRPKPRPSGKWDCLCQINVPCISRNEQEQTLVYERTYQKQFASHFVMPIRKTFRLREVKSL